MALSQTKRSLLVETHRHNRDLVAVQGRGSPGQVTAERDSNDHGTDADVQADCFAAQRRPTTDPDGPNVILVLRVTQPAAS
jgi:hypothetical protein